MTQTIDAPDAPFRVTLPIEHITKLDDGTLLVHTVATDETPDSQGEIVDYDAAKAAAPGLMEWATLGEMHDPGRMDAGTILRLHFDDDRRQVSADLHVVDPVAIRKVVSRTYKGVSIGGTKLATRLVESGGRTFRKITRLVWDEISLVNRGANPNALISKQHVVAKRATEDEMSDGAQRTPEQAAYDAVVAALAKRDVATRERDAMPDEDFAGRDRSFPIGEPDDVAAAAASIGRAGPDNYSPAELRARITAIARRKGPAFAARLPKAWRKEMKKMSEPVEPVADPVAEDGAIEKGGAPFPGAAAPFGAKGAEKKRARKHSVVVVEPSAHDDPDGDEPAAGDGAEPAEPKAAKKKLTKAQRLAKRVKRLRKENRKLAKARRRLQKRSGISGIARTLAKAGARNSARDAERIAKIHDLTTALGFDKCVAKSDAPAPGLAPSAPTTHSEGPVAKAGAPTTMREALEGRLPTETLDAMAARLAALDERSRAQGEQLAKIARQPTGGGPLTPYAAVLRGQGQDPADRGGLLAKAAEAIDDPRLRTQVSEAAALEMIRQGRSG